MSLLSLISCQKYEQDNLDASFLNVKDLDAYLVEEESKYDDIVPGTEKVIHWYKESGRKTPLSIVYIHGFSATRMEVEPVPDQIADRIGANIFFTRLKGHGRTGEALGSASLEDWFQDMEEAMDIGKKIGEKVILMGTSTGATLETWYATRSQEDIEALLFISPNFYPKNKMSTLLTWPGAKNWLVPIIGKETSFTPLNEQHALYWTESYPTQALFPMMDLVKATEKSNIEDIKVPVLIFYSPKDHVVEPKRTEKVFNQFSSVKKEILPIVEGDNEEMHVIAGDILSPSNDEYFIEKAVEFIDSL